VVSTWQGGRNGWLAKQRDGIAILMLRMMEWNRIHDEQGEGKLGFGRRAIDDVLVQPTSISPGVFLMELLLCSLSFYLTN
jgi:hypothetical protein